MSIEDVLFDAAEDAVADGWNYERFIKAARQQYNDAILEALEATRRRIAEDE